MDTSITYRPILYTVLLCLVGLGVSFFVGYRVGQRGVSSDTRVVERTELGDSLTFSFPMPEVVSTTYRPVRFIGGLVLRDTVYRDSVVYVPTDTAAVVRDYFARREYALDFSSDSTGVFKVSCAVSENRLLDVRSTVVPLHHYIDRTVTVTPSVPLLRPWVFAGCSTKFDFQYGLVGTDIGGRYMVGVGGYRLRDGGSGVLLGVGVKFGQRR